MQETAAVVVAVAVCDLGHPREHYYNMFPACLMFGMSHVLIRKTELSIAHSI